MKQTILELMISKSSSTAARGAPTEAGSPAKRHRAEVSAAPSGWIAELVERADWRDFLRPLMVTTTFHGIQEALEREYAKENTTVYPPQHLIFSAFNAVALADVRVVLLGQDPYHGAGQAHGLCFSVAPGVSIPPSLRNIYKELVTDIPGFTPPSHGYLQSWASQGVLMLNATLTVEAHKPNSHANIGWQGFTDSVIRRLSESHRTPLVFLLWGGFAKKKKSLINTKRHTVIECAHPSPLSATQWFGCKTFSKCNAALEKNGLAPIDWCLPVAAAGLR